MPTARVVLFAFLVLAAQAWARDQFDGLQCGADIPKSLVGRHDASQPAAALEQRHKELGLKDLGGTEISDRLFLASWLICGNEYELLVDTKTGVIRDALAFPAHSVTAPQFVGACQVAGKKAAGIFLAVLDNSAKRDARDPRLARTMLKATAAWKVDEASGRFVSQPAAALQCPLDGIATADGGP